MNRTQLITGTFAAAILAAACVEPTADELDTDDEALALVDDEADEAQDFLAAGEDGALGGVDAVTPDHPITDEIGGALVEPLIPNGSGVATWAACNGTTSAFATGPQCCPRSTVLRPWQRRCEPFGDLSPRRDSYGSYVGLSDRPNTLAVDSNTLQVCGMYVSDNGEGNDWPHGPYGNLYVDFFSATEPLASSADHADGRRISGPRQVRGPHRTHGTTDEWLDDEFQRYQDFGVLRWGTRSSVVLRVWESDGSEDGSWGRRNDVLGMERVSKAATVNGTWIPLHKYTNDHPRRRTSAVTGWIFVKTGGRCPR
jgi:hypothetical protein